MADHTIDSAESHEEAPKRGGGFPVFLRGDASDDQISAFVDEIWRRLQKLKADEKKQKRRQAKRDENK